MSAGIPDKVIGKEEIGNIDMLYAVNVYRTVLKQRVIGGRIREQRGGQEGLNEESCHLVGLR